MTSEPDYIHEKKRVNLTYVQTAFLITHGETGLLTVCSDPSGAEHKEVTKKRHPTEINREILTL